MSTTMAWIILVVAGLFEICWAIGLKYTQGFTKLWPSLLTAAAMVISVYLLAKAAQHLPIGTAYAVWVGIGAVGTAVLGIVMLGESTDWPRILFISLLVVSIVGLKLVSIGNS